MTATPMRAADFIATLGVNAHINDPNSSYATSDVLSQLRYLGISNARVSDYSGTQLSEYLALGAAGIKFDAVTVIAPQNPINLASEIADLNQVAPYVEQIEGPNEINTDPVSYKGLTGAAAGDAFQADLYNAIKADPALSGAQILPFSLSVGGSLTGYGNVTNYATEANVHGYASGGVPPYYFLNYAVSSVTTVTGKPVVMSETGYYTLQDGNSGVTQYVQSVWAMDTLLQNAANGVVNTYLYQLEDGYNDQPNNPEDHYGLFNTDGTPKQAAVDIHNLTTILADSGAAAGSFTPGTLNDSVSGLNPDYGFQNVFAKSNGAYDIALWSEPQFYNAATGAQANVTPSQVTISLPGAYTINVYDPVTGTAPIQSVSNATAITVALATDPLIVEVTQAGPSTLGSGQPAAGSTATAAPAPAPVTASPPVTTPPVATPPASAGNTAATTTLGSGPDTLALQVSEDAYQGDAQFTVSVNGQQIGGVQTATASHGSGGSQTFDVLGNFSGGPQTAMVTFLNDDYGGPGLDRNLYIDSAAINGQTISGSTLALDYNGSQTISFSNGAAPAAAAPANSTPPPTPAAPLMPAAPPMADDTVTLGSGRDSLALAMSEDAYNGNARFTIKVDGKQIGGTQTATALHSTGTSQSFDVLGNFSAGQHIATLTFLNDNYASPGQDRNLYLNSATIDGQAVSGATIAIPYNGPVNFAFVAPGH